MIHCNRLCFHLPTVLCLAHLSLTKDLPEPQCIAFLILIYQHLVACRFLGPLRCNLLSLPVPEQTAHAGKRNESVDLPTSY